MKNRFTQAVGIEVPVICGPMYPCTNAELVAAVSEAGGLGIVQPMSLVFVYRTDLREGLRLIRRLTQKPIGFNALVEKMAKAYEDRMRQWIDVALEEGVRFFVTSLGNPRYVVEKVHAVGGLVYHDVTERRFAEKALEAGVDGLICVNSRAGGHAGGKAPEALLEEMQGLKVPLVCAGGIGDEAAFERAMRLGYEGVQMGTRFIATLECRVHDDYKRAILNASESDIVLTDKISGVPCAVIETPFVKRTGTQAGPIARRLLKGRRTKRLMRAWYSLRSLWQFRQSSLKGISYQDYWQAGKSVEGIHTIEPAGDIVRRFGAIADTLPTP